MRHDSADRGRGEAKRFFSWRVPDLLALWLIKGNLATKSLLKFHGYAAPKPLACAVIAPYRLQLYFSR
jgi:hypothetical protein